MSRKRLEYEYIPTTITAFVCNGCPLHKHKGICQFGNRQYYYDRPDGEAVYGAEACSLASITLTESGSYKTYRNEREVIQYPKKVLVDRSEKVM